MDMHQQQLSALAQAFEQTTSPDRVCIRSTATGSDCSSNKNADHQALRVSLVVWGLRAKYQNAPLTNGLLVLNRSAFAQRKHRSKQPPSSQDMECLSSRCVCDYFRGATLIIANTLVLPGQRLSKGKGCMRSLRSSVKSFMEVYDIGSVQFPPAGTPDFH